MNPFNANAKCAKCGSADINNCYASKRTESWERCREYDSKCDVRDEHIHRLCRCCRHEWLEAPLGASVSLQWPKTFAEFAVALHNAFYGDLDLTVPDLAQIPRNVEQAKYCLRFFRYLIWHNTHRGDMQGQIDAKGLSEELDALEAQP